ncbi:MAG: peptide chain release factor N(5)-glutamine methyltransferase [Methyloceanibacter sp.]|uniref:peptide chain release factor N(5)-glutamine methyltransferase n=1 Tax=Methyloceanibacter sp. TaxID=1965321 RepID=UPI003D9AB5A8
MAETSSRSMRQAFVAAARILREAGIDTPELDARLLLRHATGLTQEDLLARPQFTLAPEVAARFDAAIARRLEREPVSRIVGMREFYGRVFLINRHTLDPRPDTETLIDATLEAIERNGWREEALRLLDLGTGTGCILLTLLAELPKAHGIGTDVSEVALLLASENARRLGLESRASFAAADWLDGIEGEFDLILANPPYVASGEIAGLAREVKDYDPLLALDGGADGLDAYRRIVAKATGMLRPGGHLMVEIGASQADAILGLFPAAGLGVDAHAVRHDLSGRPRVILLAAAGSATEQNVAA